MKYKVGDKVKIREDLEEGHTYGTSGYRVVQGMLEYRGKIATILSVDDWYYCYEIDIDTGYWWDAGMFEDVEEVDDNEPVRMETTNGFTVENVLNHTDVESDEMIIEVSHPTVSFHVAIGRNYIVRNSELYRRFIKAYGDMIVDEISVFCDANGYNHMRLKVDYKDEED